MKIDLAEAVRRLRVDAVDFTQPEFAKAAKIPLRSLVSIEAGEENLTIGTLQSILRIFGMYLTLGRMNPSDFSSGRQKAFVKPSGKAL
ncbi:TPA: helix-turn-helix domain-containing protein [Pseudomonas aeruginosa]|nr:helix-turn-helix domain-containing protein [Pseudomonas aeruginosa]HBO4704392.1 helix-turn-helix domain-containing protein [Pseudomonas aeruginosa]